MSAIIFIAVLFVLILVHEYGHFFAARKFGIWIEEFAIGFPPRLFSKKIKETVFSFNAIPLGGFVKIFGENRDDPEFINSPLRSQGFSSKPKYAQAIVLLGGIVFNILFAWILLSFAFIGGVPSSVSNSQEYVKDAKLTVVGVLPDSPASNADIKSGDVIVQLSNSKDEKLEGVDLTPENLKYFVNTHPKDEIKISILRNKEEKSSILVPKKSTDGNTQIGIAMDMVGTMRLPIHKAFWEGAKRTAYISGATMKGLTDLIGNSFKGKADLDSLTGPIGIAGAVGDASKFGFSYLISFAALISINLAIFNLIPFPALDGGRLLFLLIETIIRRPLNQKIIGYINFAGFIILIGLMLLVTYKDIIRFF